MANVGSRGSYGLTIYMQVASCEAVPGESVEGFFRKLTGNQRWGPRVPNGAHE
jgi:hypothetical protein